MRKLKYILASVVLATGFASCETEAIDEKLQDETAPGKPILRFELNERQTIVTDKVTTSHTNGFTVVRARLSISNLDNIWPVNNLEKYFAGNLTIHYSDIVEGHFPARGADISYVTLDIQHINDEGHRVWVEYSPRFASESQSTGFSNITLVNEEAGYFEGNFEYVLYPDPENDLNIVQPYRLTQGQFHYVGY